MYKLTISTTDQILATRTTARTLDRLIGRLDVLSDILDDMYDRYEPQYIYTQHDVWYVEEAENFYQGEIRKLTAPTLGQRLWDDPDNPEYDELMLAV